MRWGLGGLLVAVIGLSCAAGASADTRKTVIEWPSPTFRSLQSAIDAAPEGATVEIRAGTYELERPIFVRKRLIIRGAGSGRTHDRRVTRLVGPQPNPVTDEGGNLILRAEAVQGALNVVAADVVVQDLRLSGFDAGIVQKDDAEGNSASLVVADTYIDDTGRGILSLSSGSLSVRDSLVCQELCLWNAISVASPSLVKAVVLSIAASTIAGATGAGIYFENAIFAVDDVVVQGALGGGVVGLQSHGLIVDSDFLLNYKAGILLQDSSAFIKTNLIHDTLGIPWEGSLRWGDGIALVGSDATIEDNVIQHADRGGLALYGSSIVLTDNIVTCCGFDINVETWQGEQATIENGGGNKCGCPTAAPGECAAVSSNIGPPESVGGA